VRDLSVVVLDTPSIEVIKISSSFDLSTFSSRVDSWCDEGAGVAPEGSSSVSIGELWPNIDKLDEINGGGGSVESILGNVPRDQSSPPSVVRMNENVRHVAKRVVVDDAPGPSTAPSRGGGHGTGSATQRTKPHEFCLPPSKLFHLVCGGRLLIGNIHLRLVWIKANGRLFWRSLPTWGIL
jgi:hypothetical protein